MKGYAAEMASPCILSYTAASNRAIIAARIGWDNLSHAEMIRERSGSAGNVERFAPPNAPSIWEIVIIALSVMRVRFPFHLRLLQRITGKRLVFRNGPLNGTRYPFSRLYFALLVFILALCCVAGCARNCSEREFSRTPTQAARWLVLRRLCERSRIAGSAVSRVGVIRRCTI